MHTRLGTAQLRRRAHELDRSRSSFAYARRLFEDQKCRGISTRLVPPDAQGAASGPEQHLIAQMNREVQFLYEKLKCMQESSGVVAQHLSMIRRGPRPKPEWTPLPIPPGARCPPRELPPLQMSQHQRTGCWSAPASSVSRILLSNSWCASCSFSFRFVNPFFQGLIIPSALRY